MRLRQDGQHQNQKYAKRQLQLIIHAIIDKGVIIPDNTIIGEDHVEDAKRFHISEEGVVLVTPEMMGQKIMLDGTPIN